MNTREIEESFASPPPFADMIRAGFPNVKPGDQIETRKGDMSGMVEKVKEVDGVDYVFFRDSVSNKLYRTRLGNVMKLREDVIGSKGSQFNPTDILKMDVPLFIRLIEFAREDAKTDMELHDVTEKLTSMCKRGNTLTMHDYDKIVGQEETLALNGK